MYLWTQFAARKLRGGVKVAERRAPSEPDILGMIAHIARLCLLGLLLPSRLVSLGPVVEHRFVAWKRGVIDPITSVLPLPFAAIFYFRCADEDPMLWTAA